MASKNRVVMDMSPESAEVLRKWANIYDVPIRDAATYMNGQMECDDQFTSTYRDNLRRDLAEAQRYRDKLGRDLREARAELSALTNMTPLDHLAAAARKRPVIAALIVISIGWCVGVTGATMAHILVGG